MIVVNIIMEALSEKQMELKQTLLSIIEPTRQEAGCLSHAIYCDIQNEKRFRLLEEWETRELVADHLMTHRFSALLGSRSLLCEPMKIQIFTVSDSEGVEALDFLKQK